MILMFFTNLPSVRPAGVFIHFKLHFLIRTYVIHIFAIFLKITPAIRDGSQVFPKNTFLLIIFIVFVGLVPTVVVLMNSYTFNSRPP